jgi:hypothetical protein
LITKLFLHQSLKAQQVSLDLTVVQSKTRRVL